MIVRLKDENSSQVCENIESKALGEGGLTFPFTVSVNGKKYTYTESTLTQAIWTTSAFHTNLFHPHCRSHLIPVSEHSSMMHPNTQLDELDEMMLTGGALSYSAEVELREDTSIPEATKSKYFMNKSKIRANQTRNFLKKVFE